jgi:dihydroxy-acid dehydratase
VVVCDAGERVLSVEIGDEELRERIEKRTREVTEGNEAPWVARDCVRGYRGLYMREVNQAEYGADFEFLTAAGPRKKQSGAHVG